MKLKGHELYKRVLNLLGYINNDDSISVDNSLYHRALYAINQILVDLKQAEITDLSCEIKVNDACKEALVYGVAMLLSLIGGDSRLNGIFTEIYNSKRSAALSETAVIGDVLPTVYEGEI